LPTSSPGEQSNVDVARRGWEALNRGDVDAVLSFVHPDMEWRPAQGPGGIEGTTYRGKEAYERWLREELPEVWEDFHGEDLRFRELPDGRVLLLGTVCGRGRGSGVEVQVPFGQLARFKDGLVVQIHGYLDHQSALEAAGLSA
jgi:ketosteroid isomerase-like protein